MPTYPSAPNALDIPEPQDRPPNSLAADAWDANRKAYADWQARDRAEQIRLGYVDPATGQLTPEGWRQQAAVIGGGFGPADIGALGIGAIKAYHGSPHLFPPTAKNPLGEFDMSKMGTGEGAQVFGKGMYTADSEALARTQYRDKLVAEKGFGHYWRDASGNMVDLGALRNLAEHGDPQGLAASMLHQSPSVDAAIADVKQYGPDAFLGGKPVMDATLAGLQDMKARGLERVKDTGHMYEVNIHAEPGDYLHWDKRVSEQSPQVQQALTDLGIAPPSASYKVRQVEGGHVVDYLDGNNKWTESRVFKSAEDAEKQARITMQIMNRDPTGGELFNQTPGIEAKLRDAGIPGIRYLDAGSRGKGPNHPDATHNHATWDTDKMEIIRRYGIAGLIAGGGAAAAAGLPANALGPQEPNQ